MATAHDIHRELLSAWNARDFDRYRALLHPEYSYTGSDGREMPGGPEVGVGVARMFATAFPDGKTTLTRVYVQGDVAVAEFKATGTFKGELMGMAPTGKSMTLPVCNVIELRDGKAYREREYMDMLAMMTQVGAAPAPGGAARAPHPC
jgi:ketosteroid isomerase-like protein